MSSPYGAAYGAAKAGLVIWSKSVSVEYGHAGIRMNVVSCGVIATEAQQVDYPGGGASPSASLGRPGKPEEVAAAVVFLASPYASYISGQNLTADGSLTSRFRSAAGHPPERGRRAQITARSARARLSAEVWPVPGGQTFSANVPSR